MRVVAIYGKANVGKTTLLTMLAHEIERLNLGLIVDETDGNFTINLNDGRVVCITVNGDEGTTAENNLAYVDAKNPDLWFTAMRTSGESTNLGRYYSDNDTFYYKKSGITSFHLVSDSAIRSLEMEMNECEMKAVLYQFI